jgi:hypothetical protein
MKKVILILLLIIRFDLSAQNSKILKKVFDLNLEFKMNLDSFSNIYKVKCNEGFFDSTTVNVNGKIINLNNVTKFHPVFACSHRTSIDSYLYYPNYSDSLITFLDFYSNKLIQVTIYYIGKTKIVEESICKNYNMTVYFHKVENKRNKAYLIKEDGHYNCLVLSDKKAVEYLSPICGNDKHKGNKVKLDKYIKEEK